ncbi:MAG: exopolysaccharide biosynthesis polyprenyl glycosylphosphotransferase, partial [Acetobacteraceae bacterium]|nr:exopolysaccharide biosynthesis polyprenyl glycosylphosphotransferase [Acetobacteraceae bacterium]
ALAFILFGVYGEPLNYDPTQLWAGVCGFLAAWLLASHAQELYRQNLLLSGRSLALRAVTTCALAFGIVLLVTFGFKLIGGISRLWLLAWALSTVLWTVSTRLVWGRSLRTKLSQGRCVVRALVLACSEAEARRAARAIEKNSNACIRVAARGLLPGLSGGLSLTWIEDTIRSGAVDRVVIAEFAEMKDETNSLLARLARLAVDVTLVPDLQGLYMPSMRVERIGSIPAVDVAVRPLSDGEVLCKRIEDVFVATVAMIVLWPVLMLIALAIKLDSPGPVFFRQLRAGFHDTEFRVWKFRTMHHKLTDQGSVVQTSRDDRRVTRVGRFLRRTSLDELPQLFNVLSGEMSIVGPRPHALQMTTAGLPMREILDDYAARHRVKPGITGWAQVNGCRGEVHTEQKLRQRIAHDCFYIENWSVALDVWIILRTIALLAFDDDAY